MEGSSRRYGTHAGNHRSLRRSQRGEQAAKPMTNGCGERRLPKTCASLVQTPSNLQNAEQLPRGAPIPDAVGGGVGAAKLKVDRRPAHRQSKTEPANEHPQRHGVTNHSPSPAQPLKVASHTGLDSTARSATTKEKPREDANPAGRFQRSMVNVPLSGSEVANPADFSVRATPHPMIDHPQALDTYWAKAWWRSL